MKRNIFKDNWMIVISTVFILLIIMIFLFKPEELVELQENKEDSKAYYSVSYTAARTPSGLSKNNEREDICKWASAQEGIKQSGSPQTPFHAYFKKTTEPWCQMFITWCTAKTGTLNSNFPTKDSNGNWLFACQAVHDNFPSSRLTKSTEGKEAGWLIYEGSVTKPNHVGIYVGSKWIHGNWSSKVGSVTTSSGLSSSRAKLKNYAKPYYRSKVIYNTNKSGATYNGYSYPTNYETWYTEEKAYKLSTSGPTASGATFQGWYEESSGVTKITSISTDERGPVYVYAKWSGGGGGGGTTPPPTKTPTKTPTETPTETPAVYWRISHNRNGGYWIGSYPTWYEEGVGCSIPQYNIARTGYTFDGWYEYGYGWRYRIYASDSGDKVLDARWTPKKYPLNLYTERGKVKTGGYTFTDLGSYYYKYRKFYTYDTTEYLPTQPYGIDRRGHSFEGWYKDPSFSGASYKNLPPGTMGEQTFYAKWEPKIYDLILHKNGGTCVNPRIDNGVVVGDDIIGNYTYAKGSTFPEANDDIYKKDRIFSGWYDNSSLSGTPHTGIRSGDDDTAPIGNKEYWARWLGIIPNTPANDATEKINSGKEMILYVYFTYRIDTDASGNVTSRVSTPTAKNKRHFSVDLKVDTNPGTSSAVKVWLSTSNDPKNTSGILNWTCTSTKSKSMNGAIMNTYDNSTIKYICPNNIEDFIGGTGSKKVYVHVETITGNTGTYPINLVKRALYNQH